jgi:syntaxin 1B/2/3
MSFKKNVNQVHKLFIEITVLVKHQGEMIDNIEANISKAKNYVIKAEKDILQAKKNMMSARKKKCIILIIVLVVLLVIILPILGVKFF